MRVTTTLCLIVALMSAGCATSRPMPFCDDAATIERDAIEREAAFHGFIPYTPNAQRFIDAQR